MRDWISTNTGLLRLPKGSKTMQVILAKKWGSAEATSELFQGKGAIEKAHLSRRKFPDINSIWGGTIYWRKSPEDVWRWENATPIEDRYNYNNKSLTLIWDTEMKKVKNEGSTQIFSDGATLRFYGEKLATKKEYELADRCAGSVFEALSPQDIVELEDGYFALDDDLDLTSV